MNTVLLALLVVLFVPSVVSAQEGAKRPERARGIYFDTGLGFGGIRYLGDDATTIADAFDRTATTHLVIDLSMLTIGGALRDNLYFVATVAGVGDAYLDADGNQSQITVAMYGLGVRYYPLPSKKHLQLGLDVGANGMHVTYGGEPNKPDGMSDTGFSQRVSIGWDFDSTMTGFAVMAGGDVMLNIIEGEASVSYALFLKLVFK
jgi:hypothetical protein